MYDWVAQHYTLRSGLGSKVNCHITMAFHRIWGGGIMWQSSLVTTLYCSDLPYSRIGPDTHVDPRKSQQVNCAINMLGYYKLCHKSPLQYFAYYLDIGSLFCAWRYFMKINFFFVTSTAWCSNYTHLPNLRYMYVLKDWIPFVNTLTVSDSVNSWSKYMCYKVLFKSVEGWKVVWM